MITHGHSLVRMSAYYVLLWAPWIAFSALIVPMWRRWPVASRSRGNIAVHLGAATLIGLLHSAFAVALTVWIRPLDRMTGTFTRLGIAGFVIAQFPVELILYAAVLGVLYGVDFYRHFRRRELETARLEASLVNARLQALELQLQPHFLFNTLNAISSLVRAGKQDEAVVMIAGVSDLLRYTLEHTGQQSVTLDEESAILRRYLEIQRARFPDRLTFTIDVASDVRNAAVPTLILQPLAENAIRHGIARSAGAGEVTVRAFRQNGALLIEMFNSGSLGQSRDGVGLRNTRERLGQLYGDAHRFELRDRGDGVVASLSIPFQELP